MKLIYLKSALKCNSFDITIVIKIPFFRVSVTIEPGRSLLLFVTTNCLTVKQYYNVILKANLRQFHKITWNLSKFGLKIKSAPLESPWLKVPCRIFGTQKYPPKKINQILGGGQRFKGYFPPPKKTNDATNGLSKKH